MNPTEQATVGALVALAGAWVIVFLLALRDRRYQPKHRWTPTHRR